MNLQPSIKRFISGVAIGLFVATVAWSNSDYFNVSISLLPGIIASLVLAISFGIITSIGNIDKIMDDLPFF